MENQTQTLKLFASRQQLGLPGKRKTLLAKPWRHVGARRKVSRFSVALILTVDEKVEKVSFSSIGRTKPNFSDVREVGEVMSGEQILFLTYGDGKANPSATEAAACFAKGGMTPQDFRNLKEKRYKPTLVAV